MAAGVALADPPAEDRGFSEALLDEFTKHASRLRERSRARRAAVQLKSAVLDREEREHVSEEDMLGRRQPQDEFQGDVNMRTLQALLKMIDERGFERSPHQLKFHSAFERATARVIYRDDWGTQRPAIMKKNNWPTCPSEVLISTPRRFGKTFSIGIFAACLALTMKCEIVVFSPARRASRKLLERMVEFIRLLGHEPVEYNQEQCRVKTYDGREALIRSFPSKVGVSFAYGLEPMPTRAHALHHTHTTPGSEPPSTHTYEASATASSKLSKRSTFTMRTRPRTPLASTDRTW